MVNPSPREFFEAFYPGPLKPGQLAIYTTTGRRGKARSYWFHDLRSADRAIIKYRNTRLVHFGVALQTPKKALSIARSRRRRATLSTVRGNEESVVALPALWVEIAYGGRRRASSAVLPPDKHSALELLAAVTQRPSIVVSRGGAASGVVCAYWLLRKLWRFDPKDEKDKAVAKALLRRLRWAIESLAAEQGWRIAAGGNPAGDNLAATFLLPGGRTGGKIQRAVVEHFPLLAGDARYRRSDFETLPEPPADDRRPWRDALEQFAGLGLPRQPSDFRPIADGCSWIGDCFKNRATLADEEWRGALRLLGECAAPGADGLQLAQMVSIDHPGYDPFETASQLARELQAPGGSITCRTISEDLGAGDEHCSRCPHFGRIERPVDLAPVFVTTQVKDPAAPAELAAPVEPVAPVEPAGPVAIKLPASVTTAGWDIGDAELLEALEQVLHSLGGVATARQLADAVDRQRFAPLLGAFGRPGDPAAATALGYRLRAIKGRVRGGRTLVEVGKTRAGVAWAVQRVQPLPTTAPGPG